MAMAVSASPSKMKSSTSKLPRRMESMDKYTCSGDGGGGMVWCGVVSKTAEEADRWYGM